VVHRLLIRIIRHRRVTISAARMISESDLLQHIEDQPQRAAGYKQLIRELSLRGRDRLELESLLADLVVRGKLVLVARDRYAIASAAVNRNLVVGTLTMHRTASASSVRWTAKSASVFKAMSSFRPLIPARQCTATRCLPSFHHIHARAGTKAALCA